MIDISNGWIGKIEGWQKHFSFCKIEKKERKDVKDVISIKFRNKGWKRTS